MEKHGWVVVAIIACNKPGWPDLQCFRNAITVFIETKKISASARELQLYRHKILREQGFEVLVGKTVDDVKHLFKPKKP